ncbi:MAG: YigZ family protein [Clostridiales bacterium]|nr:YigZ family protein [Clostridiales bacterium]
MLESFLTIYKGGSGEVIEKKSRFIATVLPVEAEEEAIAYIEQMKKKHWDASHNCSAYVIGRKDEIQRCSDDGEPSKTAGKPILDVLLGEGLHNVLVIVTRYFGGTLLGTGGLVRAYQAATKEGLKNSLIINKIPGKKLRIVTDYIGLGKLQYISSQMDILFLHTEYTDIVVILALVAMDKVEMFEKKAIEVTNGKIKIESLETIYFANVLGEVQIFDT